MILDTAEFFGISLGSIEPGTRYCLIASEPRTFFDVMRVEATEPQIGLGANDKECRALAEQVESFEVEIASVHNVESARFRYKLVEDVDVVNFAIADMDEGRDIATQVHQCVQFDGPFGLSEFGPRKH